MQTQVHLTTFPTTSLFRGHVQGRSVALFPSLNSLVRGSQKGDASIWNGTFVRVFMRRLACSATSRIANSCAHILKHECCHLTWSAVNSLWICDLWLLSIIDLLPISTFIELDLHLVCASICFFCSWPANPLPTPACTSSLRRLMLLLLTPVLNFCAMFNYQPAVS